MNHWVETAAQQRSIADSTVYLLLLNQAWLEVFKNSAYNAALRD